MTRPTVVGLAGCLATVGILASAFGTAGAVGGLALAVGWYALPAPVAVAAGAAVAALLVAPVADAAAFWGLCVALGAMLFGTTAADYPVARATGAIGVTLALAGAAVAVGPTGLDRLPAAATVAALAAVLGAAAVDARRAGSGSSTLTTPDPATGVGR